MWSRLLTLLKRYCPDLLLQLLKWIRRRPQRKAAAILQQGSPGVGEWNRRRAKGWKIPDLSEVDLSGIDLRGINFRDAELRKTSFVGTNLSDAQLHDAELHGADLRRAVLVNTICDRAEFDNSNLQDANLRGANLNRTVFKEANLQGVDFTDANMGLCRLIRCDLASAVVENAIIGDVQLEDLQSVPQAPAVLRLNTRGAVLTDGDAAAFFKAPAVVEVYLTRPLSQEELGVYHLHLGELHRKTAGRNVFLSSHRYDADGSVLRFQAERYDDIYDVLPDLLAPFRMAEAIDWKQSLESIPGDGRLDAITALAKREVRNSRSRWRFAERMAEIFDGFQNSKVHRISEGRSKGVSISLFTNKDIEAKLIEGLQAKAWDGTEPLTLVLGPESSIHIGDRVVSKNSVKGNVVGGVVGSGSVQADGGRVYSESVDRSENRGDETQLALQRARHEAEQLTQAIREEVESTIAAFAEEMGNDAPDKGRLAALLSRIKESAPAVASILRAAESINKLMSGD